MATVLRWRQGVTGPTAPIELSGAAGSTLAGAAIELTIEPLGGGTPLVEDAACEVVSATGMTVRYDRQAADVAEPRRLRGYFVVTYSDGSRQPFPEQGYFLVIVEPALGTP